MKKTLIILFLTLIPLGICRAQFLDSFDGKKIEGWFFFTGDGFATMNFTQEDGFARLSVDGTKDRYNVWWAIIKRDVSSFLDVKKLQDPAYALRVEAKVRVSHANKQVERLYAEFLGKPLGKKSHELLHTHYHERKVVL